MVGYIQYLCVQTHRTCVFTLNGQKILYVLKSSGGVIKYYAVNIPGSLNSLSGASYTIIVLSKLCSIK